MRNPIVRTGLAQTMLVCTVFALACAAPRPAAAGDVKIEKDSTVEFQVSGLVRDARGNPVEGARVGCKPNPHDKNGDAAEAVMDTDASGFYAISVSGHAGKVRLTVEKDGFKDFHRELGPVRENRAFLVNVPLRETKKKQGKHGKSGKGDKGDKDGEGNADQAGS